MSLAGAHCALVLELLLAICILASKVNDKKISPQVFRLLIIQMMERSGDARLNRLFSHFVCVFALKQGASALELLLDRCQPGLTVMLLDQVGGVHVVDYVPMDVG